jgi:hypothetical protein
MDELREEFQAPALLDFVGMNEGILERTAVSLCEELLACAVPEVCVEDDAGHLPFLEPLSKKYAQSYPIALVAVCVILLIMFTAGYLIDHRRATNS